MLLAQFNFLRKYFETQGQGMWCETYTILGNYVATLKLQSLYAYLGSFWVFLSFSLLQLPQIISYGVPIKEETKKKEKYWSSTKCEHLISFHKSLRFSYLVNRPKRSHYIKKDHQSLKKSMMSILFLFRTGISFFLNMQIKLFPQLCLVNRMRCYWRRKSYGRIQMMPLDGLKSKSFGTHLPLVLRTGWRLHHYPNEPHIGWLVGQYPKQHYFVEGGKRGEQESRTWGCTRGTCMVMSSTSNRQKH